MKMIHTDNAPGAIGPYSQGFIVGDLVYTSGQIPVNPADGSRHPFDTFICAKTPAGRWGDPEDMVGPCVFLASHASDFVNGQILYADGGILAYIGRQPK